MAGVGIFAQVLPVAFSTVTKTLVQFVPPANQRIVVNEWDVSFNGTSNTATPIEVDIVRQTSAGTSSALTIRKRNTSDSETVQSSALQTFTAEPTDGGDVPLSEQVHPQTGYTWQPGYGREVSIPGGGRLGLRLVTPGAGANATARLAGEE
jgi:hypothetical protein